MKTIELGRSGNILVKSPDGQKSKILVKKTAQERAKAALTETRLFVANNSELVTNLMGGGIEDDLSISQNPDFISLVNAIRFARVSKTRFQKAVSSLVENSPSSPEEHIGKLMAMTFTDVVYREKERLDIEARVRKNC